MLREFLKFASVAIVVCASLKIKSVRSTRQCNTKYCDECDACCFGTQGKYDSATNFET